MQKNRKKICIYQKFVVILHRLSKMNDKRTPKSNQIKTLKLMKKQVNKQNVIARIIKGGFNPKNAEQMVAKFWELAERRGCETICDYYQEITWFWATA